MEAPKRIVLDTTIIVKHLRGKREETELVEKLQQVSSVATTIVNSFEVYYGAYKSKQVAKNVSSAKGILGTLEILGLSKTSPELAGKVMAELESEGKTLDPRDALIGSSENGYSVLTLNSKHFERIPALQVLEPEEIRF